MAKHDRIRGLRYRVLESTGGEREHVEAEASSRASERVRHGAKHVAVSRRFRRAKLGQVAFELVVERVEHLADDGVVGERRTNRSVFDELQALSEAACPRAIA